MLLVPEPGVSITTGGLRIENATLNGTPLVIQPAPPPCPHCGR